MVITDAVGRGLAATSAMVAELSRGLPRGSLVVQVRDRDLPDGMRLIMCRELRDITGAYGQWLSVNDRCDWALLVGAEGVHLPANAPAADRIRGVFRERGRDVFLTRAVHDANAKPSGVDGVVVSPVFAGRKGRMPIGIEPVLRARAGSSSTHHFALGGVGAAQAETCLLGGLHVAVMGAAYAETTHLVRVVSKFWRG